MSDTLVLDMSTQSEGAAAVFTKRDWLTILDNQNQNYQGNQCVIDTSQLANSNKYMNYREAYVTIPMLITLTSAVNAAAQPQWTATGTSPDWSVGLKNWYGSIIHSFTLDYNGTTIIQQTPYIGLWNSFKLMTSLSLDDIKTQGSLIGFYPDTAGSVQFYPAATDAGLGVCNNAISSNVAVTTILQNHTCSQSQSDVGVADMGLNTGLYKRIQAWNFDSAGQAGILGSGAPLYGGTDVLSGLISGTSSLNTLWQSYVLQHTSGNNGAANGIYQVAILGIVYLKHVASFFERVPLVKGVFMKLTLNLNQSSVSYTIDGGANFSVPVVNSPLGGVSPLMLSGRYNTDAQADSMPAGAYILSLAVGGRCLNSSQTSGLTNSPLNSQIGGGSITLNVPAYTFNPVFEQSYLASPVKKVVYTDVYQYQVLNVAANSTFNNLVTNGIANIKSVLLLPFYTATANAGLLPIQSPFDPAGGGPTSPLIAFSQFNVQISGQNAIYNTERYAHEQFANQFKGVNAINGGQTDGLTSGLIGYKDWTQSYTYYYVNCGRMLPVEEAVPKSVNVLGQNMSAKAIDMYVFVEYGVEVSIDILTGARV